MPSIKLSKVEGLRTTLLWQLEEVVGDSGGVLDDTEIDWEIADIMGNLMHEQPEACTCACFYCKIE